MSPDPRARRKPIALEDAMWWMVMTGAAEFVGKTAWSLLCDIEREAHRGS